MYKYKDEVIYLGDDFGLLKRGGLLIVEQDQSPGCEVYCRQSGYDYGTRFWINENLLINNNDSQKESTKTMNNLKEKFLLAITAEPMKSFRKAGITNGDDLLTDDGQKVFLSWLLKENKDKFKTDVVDGILKDEEKE